MESNLNQLLLVDKPKGITSFDVIRILRKQLGIQKIGHAGTLDPFATGLLILGVDKGTKLLSTLIGLSKTYEAEILLGTKTDTGDITGAVIEEKPVPEMTVESIEEALIEFWGTHKLPVPMYSAIKKDGKALYEYAREGKEVEIPVKSMVVLDASLLTSQLPVLRVFFEVTSGSYIRTLAEKLAEDLGTVGTLVNLRRLSIGDYTIEDARTINAEEYIMKRKRQWEEKEIMKKEK
jgi:tRNA pseudouridine55 synthase